MQVFCAYIPALNDLSLPISHEREKPSCAQGEMLAFLCRLRRLDHENLTVQQFWRELARLGGFLGRTHDGEPGWQTIWRGWNDFYPRFGCYLMGK